MSNPLIVATVGVLCLVVVAGCAGRSRPPVLSGSETGPTDNPPKQTGTIIAETDDPSADLETFEAKAAIAPMVAAAAGRGRECGKERWAVKTLSDDAVDQIDFDTIVREHFEKVRPGLVGKTVTVTGVGFFDRFHNQTGMADSCMELHPVLTIELGQ
jgi:hypothetical protein